MVRGELVTSYLKPGQGFKTIADCVAQVEAFYQNEPFVRVLRDEDPDTKWVRGSNRCYLRYVYDPRTERLIAQAAIDNLTKGAAGQAVQCFNLRFGFDEAEGLSGVALFP